MPHITDEILDYLKFYQTSGVAIQGKPEPEQRAGQAHIWEVWQDYLTSKGHLKSLRFWKHHLAHGGKGLTLPCEDPNAFDRFVNQRNAPRSSAEAPRTAKYSPRAYRDD